METVDISQLVKDGYDRGFERGQWDKQEGHYQTEPLSGEWAGESVIELLGDLIGTAEQLYQIAQGVGEDDPTYWSDLAEMGALASEICEAYEDGYSNAFLL